MEENGVEPGGEPAGAVETGQASPGLDQGFCDEVLGEVLRTAQGDGLAVEPALEGLADGAKRLG